MRCRLSHGLASLGIAFGLLVAPGHAGAHGSVVPEEDLCLIQIGYLKAHFKIFLPRTRRHEEFCEDLPDVGESVFVMEYVHSGLGDMPIEFRIIRDATGLGRFAKHKDVLRIDNLDAVTVLHQPATIQPDVFAIVQHFDTPGWYIGIVTASREDIAKVYTAVFPFRVGFAGLGVWPWFVGLAILLQLQYWYMTGTLARWWTCWTGRGAAVTQA